MNIKVRALSATALILLIAGIALMIIAHFNPGIYWIRDCANLCIISGDVCLFIELIKSKGKVSTKKIVLGFAIGTVLTLAVIWIILIKFLNVGLE